MQSLLKATALPHSTILFPHRLDKVMVMVVFMVKVESLDLGNEFVRLMVALVAQVMTMVMLFMVVVVIIEGDG